MAKTFCFDPGHGGIDPGAVNGNRREADDNLRMALEVKKNLVAQGHTVILTHAGLDSRKKLELADRRQIAADAKADLFVSLHRNSAQKKDSKGNLLWNPNGTPVLDPSAKGVEVWIRNKLHTQAASTVLEQLAQAEHQANRGIKTGSYAVLYNMPMPSMLIELGFISNPKDNELFDKHFDDYARQIAMGVVWAAGEEWKLPPDKPAAEDAWYRIQVGAFRSKKNADDFLRVVRDMGLQAFPIYPENTKEK